MYSSQKPRQEPQAHAHFPFILPALCMSVMMVTSLNDVTIICSPFLVGKTLHIHSGVMLTHLHICWHPCHWFWQLHQLCMNNLINSVSQFLSLWHIGLIFFHYIHSTLHIMKKKYAEILLHYRQLFIKGDIIIGEWGTFGVEIFLHYSHFLLKVTLL